MASCWSLVWMEGGAIAKVGFLPLKKRLGKKQQEEKGMWPRWLPESLRTPEKGRLCPLPTLPPPQGTLQAQRDVSVLPLPSVCSQIWQQHRR